MSADKENPYSVPQFAGAILCLRPERPHEPKEWRLVKRSDGRVYLYDTIEEAEAMLKMCYPELAWKTAKKVLKVKEEYANDMDKG